MEAKELQEFCRKSKKVKNVNSKTKKALCDELILLKASEESYSLGPAEAAAASTVSGSENNNSNSKKKSKKGAIVLMNYYRVVNVLALDMIQPLLQEISGHLSRAELDAGRKSGSRLFEAMTKAYNDANNEELLEWKWGFFPPEGKDLAQFQEVTVARMEGAFKSMRSEYTTMLNSWLVSGTNGEPFEADFEVEIDFDEFVNRKYQYVYLHLFLVSITRDFNNDTSTWSANKRSQKKKNSRDSDDGIQEKMIATMQERNKVIAAAASAETSANRATAINQLSNAKSKATEKKRNAKQRLLQSPKSEGDKDKFNGTLYKL